MGEIGGEVKKREREDGGDKKGNIQERQTRDECEIKEGQMRD